MLQSTANLINCGISIIINRLRSHLSTMNGVYGMCVEYKNSFHCLLTAEQQKSQLTNLQVDSTYISE